jgi:hypothetical protein
MDEALRSSIWNLLVELIELASRYASRREEPWRDFALGAAADMLKVPVDAVPYDDYAAREWLLKRFGKLEWFAAYDFLEYFVVRRGDTYASRGVRPPDVVDRANRMLERELSGFRFVSGHLSRIARTEEVTAIEEAAKLAARAGLPTAEAHLVGAVQLLGRRPEPDYRNSIKESISAVESTVNLIAGTSGGGVAKALDALAEKVEIHGALKSALAGLYGYTSNEDGIRHAMLEQSTVGYDEAKFMLVACSAFVYFLISKAAGAGLLRA